MSRAAEILKKVQRIEITTRKMVESLLAGSYHTKFKGHGMQFADLREYYLGDDIRHIDWKVTARTQSAHIKKFEEERELNVYFLVDVSSSGIFGSQEKTKQEVLIEVCALLSFAAVRNNDKVGIILFTDGVERHIPPKKGLAHAMRIVSEVLYFEPKGTGTNLSSAFDYCYKVMKARGVVFVLSDFYDSKYEMALKKLARRHQVTAISITDSREKELPAVGYIEMIDSETGESFEVNTNLFSYRKKFKEARAQFEKSKELLFKGLGISKIEIDTNEDYFKKIIEYFVKKGSAP